MLIKKQITNKQSELKSKVFESVRGKLIVYRKTPEYVKQLENQIDKIIKEYGDLNITIYIDPEDSHLLNGLNESFNVNIEVYKKEFLGGTRTIVPEKNILIDNSFKTRLIEEQEQFAFIF